MKPSLYVLALKINRANKRTNSKLNWVFPFLNVRGISPC